MRACACSKADFVLPTTGTSTNQSFLLLRAIIYFEYCVKFTDLLNLKIRAVYLSSINAKCCGIPIENQNRTMFCQESRVCFDLLLRTFIVY